MVLRTGSVVDVILISALGSTKINSGMRDRKMRQIQKGGDWYVGMKAYNGVGAESDLVHTVISTRPKIHRSKVSEIV